MGRCKGSVLLKEVVIYVYCGNCETLVCWMNFRMDIHVFAGRAK